MRNRAAICGAMISLIVSMSAAHAGQNDRAGSIQVASDVWIQQAHGNMPAGTPAEINKAVKATPEGTNATPTAAAGSSPATPATCNQQNASSPSCYSATQQAKGK